MKKISLGASLATLNQVGKVLELQLNLKTINVHFLWAQAIVISLQISALTKVTPHPQDSIHVLSPLKGKGASPTLTKLTRGVGVWMVWETAHLTTGQHLYCSLWRLAMWMLQTFLSILSLKWTIPITWLIFTTIVRADPQCQNLTKAHFTQLHIILQITQHLQG